MCPRGLYRRRSESPFRPPSSPSASHEARSYAHTHRNHVVRWCTVVAGGKLLQPSAESAVIYSGTASGSWYHLLVVQGYFHVKGMPNKVHIKGCSFRAGGYQWALQFYPNGNRSINAGFLSVFLFLDQDVEQTVKVHVQFSFIDEVAKQEPAQIHAREKVGFFSRDRSWGRRRLIRGGEDLEKSGHLKDDCFTIRCDFLIVEAAATFIKVPPSNICQHLNHLFTTKVGTDVTFEVGNETFAAHRCVLAARSMVFMAELFGPMKEGTTIGAIHVDDMEPDVFKALLDFIYMDSMPKMEGEAEEDGAEVLMWLRHLLAAADRYHLQRLISTPSRLSEHIDVTSVTAILGAATQHHCGGLKEACLEFLKGQSAEDLRQVMATSDWEHIVVTYPSVVNELIVKLASKM
ncbi:hypothetical protein VPH35_004867 [Triticum aestivum]